MLPTRKRQAVDYGFKLARTVWANLDISEITGMGVFKAVFENKSVRHALRVVMSSGRFAFISADTVFMNMESVLARRDIFQTHGNLKPLWRVG